ncbi:hypothetical protein BaRGS_00006083 [Batillaria attramentaria]|uniref:Uncharacterized protein n=1 Tax=Batillaria attramentaria TaxID=370345 RepID=A0ABD0LUP3_9CAEN
MQHSGRALRPEIARDLVHRARTADLQLIPADLSHCKEFEHRYELEEAVTVYLISLRKQNYTVTTPPSPDSPPGAGRS